MSNDNSSSALRLKLLSLSSRGHPTDHCVRLPLTCKKLASARVSLQAFRISLIADTVIKQFLETLIVANDFACGIDAVRESPIIP